MSQVGRWTVAALVAATLVACESQPYRRVVLDGREGDEHGQAEEAAPATQVLRFSVAAIESPRDTYAAYTRLFDRVGQLLQVRVQFEQRRTYREVNDLILAGRLDAALLCTGGYLDLVRRAPGAVEVLAVPVLGGEQSYRSLVVVPASSAARALEDLRGARFAFTDELSFSGRLYAVRLLRDRGLDPGRFFGTVTYTGSHDRSIQAVASGLVDGAAVHGGVLEQMAARDPSLRRRLRVVQESPPLGGMPVVVSTRLPPAARARLRDVLLHLGQDPDGAESLHRLRFDRFAEPAPDLYATAAKILEPR